MKIAVIGCGAMGSIYAGLLASDGHEVLAIDRWANHVATINRNGLEINGASGHRVVRLRAAETVPVDEHVDMLIISVKSAAAETAAEAARGLIGPSTIAITIQNGLGAADEVAKWIDPDRLIVGIAGGFGASLISPGRAHHNGMQIIRFGAYSELSLSDVEAVVAVWRSAGFQSEAARDIKAMQWEKLICNIAYSAPCTLTGLTVGEAMDDPDLGPTSRAAAIEGWEIARARGINIDIDDPVDHVRAFAARMPAAKPSMLLDFEAGRASEIDYINGAIPREAARADLKAPVNETLTRLVRIKERDLASRK